jgi:HD-GYP domain-containing protein (c-di-GMP phosphodiesterase class II)
LYEGLLNSAHDLETANLHLEENFRQTIVGFANAIEESDPYTRGHSERVAAYTEQIARALRLDSATIDTFVLSAQVHDIGKIGIPTDKLNKPDTLTAEELKILQTHPEKGRRILEPVPFLRKLIPGAYTHHERFDGMGYPEGLGGEEIPLMGRVIAVADAYDAMTSSRPYRKAMAPHMAVAELRRCAGTQFDPQIATILADLIEQRHPHSSAATTTDAFSPPLLSPLPAIS